MQKSSACSLTGSRSTWDHARNGLIPTRLDSERDRRSISRMPNTGPLAIALAMLATPLPALSAQNGAAPTWTRALDSLVAAELARTGTPGVQVAIVANGQLAYSKGYGIADIESGRPVSAQTLFRVGSVTKMVTAATLTQLAVQGKLDLHAPIGRYVTEVAGRRVADVTTHQLLTHSAGWIDNATAYGRMGEGALGEVFREVSDTLFFTQPGRVISYSNPGYSMAGYVSERAGGARFGDLAERLVLRKMGMPRATFRPLSALTHDFSQGHIGIPGQAPVIVRPFTENTAQWAAGFLFASAEELARFTIALMDGGMLDGEQVLASEAITMMTTGHMDIPGSASARYAYGLRVGTQGAERVWSHGGSINGFDADVTMYPDRKLAVLVFDNRSGADLRGITEFVVREAAGIEPAPAPAKPTPVDLDAAARARLVGSYAQGRVRVVITDTGDALAVRQGTSQVPAMLMSNDELVVTYPGDTERRLRLVRGADGRVEYLHTSLRALARQP